MTDRARQWKPSSQQAARYRTHHDSQQPPTAARCSSNEKVGTLDCEEGLTYIIENAFEHRPRSLPSKGSIANSGFKPAGKKNDGSVMADTTCSGFTFDDTLASISSRSIKSKGAWNSFSSSVKELSDKFQHFPYLNASSLRFGTRIKVRFALMSCVFLLLYVTLQKHNRTQQQGDQHLVPQLKVASQLTQHNRLSGRFVEVDSGKREVNDPKSLLTENLLIEVRSSVRSAAYYDSSTSLINATIELPVADSQKDKLQDNMFLMPPTDPVGGKSQIKQEMKDTKQHSRSAVATEAGVSSSSSDFDTLNSYKDTWEPHEESDTPVFLHIPKAGGSTMKDIIGTCHRKILASESGVAEGHGVENVSFNGLFFRKEFSFQSLTCIV